MFVVPGTVVSGCVTVYLLHFFKCCMACYENDRFFIWRNGIQECLTLSIPIVESNFRDTRFSSWNSVVVLRRKRSLLFPLLNQKVHRSAHIDHRFARNQLLDALVRHVCLVVEFGVVHKIMSLITDNIGVVAFDAFQRLLRVFLIVFLEFLVGLNLNELKIQTLAHRPINQIPIPEVPFDSIA